jgi:site-specific recombinase XerD
MPKRRDDRGRFLEASKNYEYLLDFTSMRNWDMSLRSSKTKDLYFRTMHLILHWTGSKGMGIETPDDLLKAADSTAIDVTRKFSHQYRAQGKLKMAEMVKTIVKSFFSGNNRELRSPLLKVHKVPKQKRTDNRIVPTKDQVYLMADAAAGLKEKAVILMLWQSGLRNSTFRNLTIGQVKAGLLRDEVPLKVDITPDTDKKSRTEPYYTFIDRAAVEALKRYLSTRGEVADLHEEAPLVLSNNRGGQRKLSDRALRSIVKKAAENAGLNPNQIWPHCLRAAFYNMLVGKVDDGEREFLFGHLRGIRDQYFAPQWADRLRGAYATVGWDRPGTELTRDEVRTEVISALMGKISEAELAPVASKLGIAPQQIRAMIRRIGGKGSEKETEALLETERPARKGGKGNHCESKLIPEAELCEYINGGWELVKELSNGKILVKKLNDA